MDNRFVYSQRTYFLTLILLILSSLVLSSCGIGIAETDITVYEDKYRLNTIINIPADEMEMIGGPTVFAEALNDYIVSAENEGIEVTWRDNSKKDGTSYQYELSSDLIQITDEYKDSFSWRQIRYKNRDAYEFIYSSLSSFLNGFQSFTITLHAGKILDSNGTQIDGRTVTWVNPTVTPRAIVTPKGTNVWLPLLFALVLAAAAAFVIYKKLTIKKILDWGSTTLNVGKWKIQETKLAGEVKTLEQDKTVLLKELGAKTWEARIFDQSYSAPYQKLETLQNQIALISNEKDELEANLKELQKTKAETTTHYSNQLTQLQSELNNVTTSLEHLRDEQNDLEKELSKLDKEKNKLSSEIQGYERQLSRIQTSDVSDKDSQILSLTSAISTVSKTLEDINNRTPENLLRVENIKNEQRPLSEQIKSLKNQIELTQSEQKSKLEPLAFQIKEIDSQLINKRTAIDDVKKQMEPIISDLGGLANSTRPVSEILTPQYERLNKKIGELDAKNEENNLIIARLGMSDKKAVRNFVLTLVGLIVVLVLIGILLSLAF